MTIGAHMTGWAGKEVVDWQPGKTIEAPERRAYALRMSWDELEEGKLLTDRLIAYLAMPGAEQTTALVIGNWAYEPGEDSSTIVETLVVAREQLPNLTALFLGDITYEENEISWIEQSDLAPLFSAYPNLTHFGVRGGAGLSLGVNRHERLQHLVIETGGLPREVLTELWQSEFPALEHLELWLGTEHYGWTGTIEDLAPLFSGDLFPRLRYLGLCDSEIADEIAEALVRSPLLTRLEILDLSLGTLTDRGAGALVWSEAVRQLKKLDLHYHYCSTEMMQQLQELGIEVDVSDPQLPEEDDYGIYRYVAVGE